MTYKVFIEEYSETVENAEEFQTRCRDLVGVAEEFAKHFHNERDGWEASWPKVFTVANEQNEILGRVEVEREYDPYFSGRVVKESDT